MNLGTGFDVHTIVKTLAGAAVGVIGALAMWFNDILNHEAEFSFANFFMLCFIGATIGSLAVMVAPFFHIDDNYITVFACVTAAAHKYILRSVTWFLDKWTSVSNPNTPPK
jgi:predicted tellurium resistance membrane protein TerC